MKKFILTILTFILLSSLASAVVWSPQGDINLKNRYDITNWNISDCGAGTAAYGINSTGSWLCRVASGGGGDKWDVSTSNYLINNSDVLDVNETKLNATIDARDTDTTYTATSPWMILIGTVFSWNSTLGDLTYLLVSDEGNLNVNHSSTSDSATSWDGETSQADLNVNHSSTCDTATTWDGETSQANLNVNSSDYWDSLNTPADINAGDITDDGTYVKISGDTMTGNLNMQNNGVNLGGSVIKNLTVKNSNINGPALGIYQTGPSTQNLPHLILQSGGGTQASVLLRSFLIANEIAGFHNTSKATDCGEYMTEIGEVLKIDCNTTTTGADLLVSDDMQVVGDAWLKDASGEWHFFSRDLSLLDGLNNNILFNLVDSSKSVSAGVFTINITSNDGSGLSVNLNKTNTLFSTVTDLANMTCGTNSSPTMNYVFYTNPSSPVLGRHATDLENTQDVADVGQILLGDCSGTESNVLGSIFGSATQEEFIHDSKRTMYLKGAFPISGYNIDASSGGDWNVSSGSMRIIDWTIATGFKELSDGVFVVLNNGSFAYYSDLQDISEYSSGQSISGSDEFSVVLRLVLNTVDNTSRVLAVVQKGNVIYTRCATAEQDRNKQTTSFSGNAFLDRISIPFGRVVVRKTNGDFCNLGTTSDPVYIDTYFGDQVGGTSGAAPAIPSHDELENLEWSVAGHTFDTNLDVGSYNVSAQQFFGSLDCSNISGASSDLCTLTNDNIFDQSVNTTDSPSFSGLTLSGTGVFSDDVMSVWGSSSDSSCQWDTGQTPDSLVCGLGASSNARIYVEQADVSSDFSHPLQTDPTIFVHSANGDSLNWTSLSHDGVDSVLDNGNGGNISLEDSVRVEGDLNIGDKVGTLLMDMYHNGTSFLFDSFSGMFIFKDNVVVEGNVTAEYFIGNGSQLTGISSGGGDLWSDLVDSDIVPDTTNVYDLGDSTHGFDNLYIDDVFHSGDTDTYIDFGVDQMGMYVGARNAFFFMEGSDPDMLTLNNDRANVDIQIKGDVDRYNLFSDASTDRIGIGSATPSQKLHVEGNINATGNITVGGGLIYYNGSHIIID